MPPPQSPPRFLVHEGDARSVLKTWPDKFAHCCVTSPPYFGLRDYGHAGQIGLEQTPEAYVAELVAVFREVHRGLRDDGTLWLNLGDSYARNPAKGKSGTPNGRNIAEMGYSGGAGLPSGVKEKDLIGIPWMVAFALRADGWYLRQDIIWHKPNPMPESVTDRCTKSHEYVFMLSKSKTYFYDAEAVKEEAVCGAKGSQFHTGKSGEHQQGRVQKVRPSRPKGSFAGKTEAMASTGQNAFRAIVDMRNRRSVWTIPTRPFKEAHFATFPPALAEPCILAGSPVGGAVIDPFGGAGTTGLVATQHNRLAFLCELNPDYAKMARERIQKALDTPTIL